MCSRKTRSSTPGRGSHSIGLARYGTLIEMLLIHGLVAVKTRLAARETVVLGCAAIMALALTGESSRAAEHPHVGGGPARDTSLVCLECHDGVMARNVRVGLRPAFGSSSASVIERERREGHPIGMDYAKAAAVPGARLRRVSTLDPAIRLDNGRVGCTSCHDISSPRPANLVRPARGGLCLGCHEL